MADKRLAEPKTPFYQLLRELAEDAMSVTHHDAAETEPGYIHEVQDMERRFRRRESLPALGALGPGGFSVTPAGWRLVPVNPVEQMHCGTNVWQSLLAAAPDPLQDESLIEMAARTAYDAYHDTLIGCCEP